MQIIDQLKDEYFVQRKLGLIKSLHMTIDFYYKAVADLDLWDVSTIGPPERDYLPFFGLDPNIHFEPTEKPFWFEIESWEQGAGVQPR